MSQNAVLGKTGDEKCLLEADQSSKIKDNNLSSKSTKNACGGNLTDFDVFMHLMNAHAGVGVLGLPYAMKYCGSVLGPLMILCLGLVYLVACRIIVVTGQAAMDKYGENVAEYNTMLRLIYTDSPKTGRFMDHLVGASILIMHFGYWVAYIIFIATNLTDISVHWFPALESVSHYNLLVYAVVGILLLALCSFDLDGHDGGMNAISLVGSVAITGGLIAISVCAAIGIDGKQEVATFKFSGIPVAFGMIISAYEAQATAISVYNDARNRTRFMPIFSAVVGLYSTLMISSGVIGYVRFGDAVKGNWVANMPNTPTLAVIKITYSIAVFMSYPVMCVVTNRMYTPGFKSAIDKWCKNSATIADYTVRYSSVVLPCIIAYIFPFFGDICALVGCIGSTTMGMIIPPIMDTAMMPQNWQTRLRNGLIIGIGIFGGTSGTVETLRNIIKKVKT